MYAFGHRTKNIYATIHYQVNVYRSLNAEGWPFICIRYGFCVQRTDS